MKTVLILTSFLIAVPAAFADATPDGSAIYKTNCSACHGANGEGKSFMKTTPFKKSLIEDAIIKIVANGKDKMPAFKAKLSPDEISQVAKHVKSLGK